MALKPISADSTGVFRRRSIDGAGSGVPRLRPALAKAGARNRSPGRHGNRSPDTRTRLRGASLHALRRRMTEPEARTRRPKIATVERREARVPDRKGTRGASQAPRRAASWYARGASQAPRAVSALYSPSFGEGKMRDAAPARELQRAAKLWLFDIVRCECRVAFGNSARQGGVGDR